MLSMSPPREETVFWKVSAAGGDDLEEKTSKSSLLQEGSLAATRHLCP